MANYLSDLIDNPAFETLETSIPAEICPYFFYNLTPYIFTLAKGGWFGWTENRKDIAYRKEIRKTDFSRKDVNRRYPNEVLVRCPNPVSGIVAGLGPWSDNTIKLRILNGAGVCHQGYQIGDWIVLNTDALVDIALTFNARFPEVLMQSLAGEIPQGTWTDCHREHGPIITVSKIIYPCRYHKRRLRFGPEAYLPDGFCPHVFARAYPHILALMYGAQIENSFKVHHPGHEGLIALKLKKVNQLKNQLLNRILRLAQKGFETLFYPVDLLDYDIEIIVKGTEPAGCSLVPGEVYKVNMKSERFLCPASFHTLYPYVLLCASGLHMDWGREEPGTTLPCPDCIGAVYSIC